MDRPKKPRRPGKQEAATLKMIAQSAMLKTHTPDGPNYSLRNGRTIARDLAERLIAKGWVRPESPGLWPGDDQTYVALKP